MPAGIVERFEPVHIERRDRPDALALRQAVVIKRLPVEKSGQKIQTVVVRVKNDIEEYTAHHDRGGQFGPADEYALDGRRSAEKNAGGNDPFLRAALLKDAPEREDQNDQDIEERDDERDNAERSAVKSVFLIKPERDVAKERRAVDKQGDRAGDPPIDVSVFSRNDHEQ